MKPQLLIFIAKVRSNKHSASTTTETYPLQGLLENHRQNSWWQVEKLEASEQLGCFSGWWALQLAWKHRLQLAHQMLLSEKKNYHKCNEHQISFNYEIYNKVKQA